MKKKTLVILLALLCIAVPALSSCGGSSGSGTAGTENAQDETAFLLGSWFAEKATYNGEEVDPDEIYGGTFYLYFTEDECQMCIDQKRAPLKWEYTGDGVTLSGDDTYEITFPDDSRTSMVITVNGVETLLTKYDEK